MQRSIVRSTLLSFLLLGVAVAANAELIYVVGDNNTLISIQHTTPGQIVSSVVISGLALGEVIRGIDFRPASAQIYAITSGNRLFTINPATGVALQVGAGFPNTPLQGTNVGFDFNPVADRIRVTTDLRENLRFNPDTGGFVSADTLLAYAAADVNASQTPTVTAVAYTNSIAFSPGTTLYGIDAGLNTLVRQGSLNGSPTSPNSGTLFTIGSLGVDAGLDTNFDISSVTPGIAFATIRSSAGTDLYEIDLSTGTLTRRNTIAGTMQVSGMAVAQDAVVFTVPIIGSAAGQNNTSFRGDLNIVNSSAFPATVKIDFFESGGGAKTAPTATFGEFTLAAGEQRIFSDVVKTLFNRDPGTGALRITASRPVAVVGRIYNQTANGTFGQFIRGAEESERRTSGILPALKNTPSINTTGFRTNVGWFNPNTAEVTAVFTARGLNGATLAGPVTVVIPALTQSQQSLNSLFPTLDFGIDTYVTFTTGTTPGLFAYASVIDNITGDAIYVPALRN